MQDLSWEVKHYLDACAAVKLVLDEPYSDRIRDYYEEKADQGFEFYMTLFCFYEALGVLKRKYKSSNRIERIDRDEYFRACGQLTARLAIDDIQHDQLRLTDHENYLRVENIAQTYDIDISDALQIVTVKHGKWSQLVAESQSMLITADRDLAEAARDEGLRVWNILDEEEPT